jgi:hypothetical protein
MEGGYSLATLTFNLFLGLVYLALASRKREEMLTTLHCHIKSYYPHRDIPISIILL